MKKIGSLLLCAIIGFSILPKNVSQQAFAETTYLNPEKDAMIFATEPLSGNFNPFYATLDSDKNIVSQTQISMLSLDDNGTLIAGDDQPTVVKAFDVDDSKTTETVYTFVIKNGLKFSDGKPLTMNDVMFNIYEYLDPVYTASSTMYSIDIKGLTQYRLQANYSFGGDAASEQLSKNAAAYGQMRILELVNVYEENGLIEGSQNSYSLDEAGMREAIAQHEVTDGYKDAIATPAEQAEMTADDYRAQLLADYELTLKTFEEELESDFKAAKESYDLTTAPYKDWAEEMSNDIFKFFLYEGYIIPEYADDMVNLGKKEKTKIEKFNGTEVLNNYDTQEKAINRVYNDNVKTGLNMILTAWGTAGTLRTKYTADALDVLLHANVSGDGDELSFPNISGVVSLGHTTETTEVEVAGTKYKVAQSHNTDGTPVNNDEYDVLQITVNGVNPQAIYSFNFPVAPAHYYTADAEHPNGREIDIANNQFGVEFASSAFQRNVIQSKQHEVPVGAGVYKAIEGETAEAPKGAEFYHDGVVYFQRNEYFHTVGSGLNNAKIKYMQYKEIPSHQVLDALKNGDIHFGEPPLTKAVINQVAQMDMVGEATYWHNSYGYIGINAGKVPNINIRRAIMASMQTSLALEYYYPGTCTNIDWPMSMESWAYPFEADGKTSKPNGKDYMQWTDDTSSNYADAKAEIQKYMNLAGVSAGSIDLKIKFTIAGASITEHPTYTVFKQSAELLNSMGWDVEVVADSQALTKLSTGSLAVWAAAWGSTIDPDMYQVYHKNSTATSVYAWGYREIKSNQTQYREENRIIHSLSELIDDGRATMVKADRTEIYEDAMRLVLDLAVELPVYQRKDLILWNKQVIDSDTLNLACNSIVGLTDRLWEIDFAEKAELPPDDSGNDDSDPPAEDENYPKFRWNEEINLWEVSYDDGETWITLEEKKDDSDTPAEDENYPKFRWNEEINLWEVSYDDGETWITLEEKKDDSDTPAEDENYPKFRWNEEINLWEVSYDDGETWITLEEKKNSSSDTNAIVNGCGGIVGGELSVLLVLGGVLLLKKQKWE